LFVGSVSHRRLRPVPHNLRQGVCALLIDLDDLSTLGDGVPLFSVNRHNVFSFFEADHGPRDGSSLKVWIRDHLRANGIEFDDGCVRVLCFPRMLGYVFNPLAVWFCHDASGWLRAILMEVSNLAGESHSYLVTVPSVGVGEWVRARFEKRFYVSAFVGMDAYYDCSIKYPDDDMGVCIREFEQNEETLVATWTGRRRPLTTRGLLTVLTRYPLMTLRISAAIYWHGLCLLCKRVPRYAGHAGMPSTAVDYVGVAELSAPRGSSGGKSGRPVSG
jgi:DUF1365 family protein